MVSVLFFAIFKLINSVIKLFGPQLIFLVLYLLLSHFVLSSHHWTLIYEIHILLSCFAVVELYICKEILSIHWVMFFSGQVFGFFCRAFFLLSFLLYICTVDTLILLVLFMLVLFILIYYRWILISHPHVSETGYQVSAGYFVFCVLFYGFREWCEWEGWKGYRELTKVL